MAGIALFAAAAARAELFSDTWGQERTYRWNEQRTGFGFDPTDPLFAGLPSNQLPSLAITEKLKNGQTYQAMSPDLTWIYPLDVEGGDLDNLGNQYPLGYTLGEIHSSPTVAAVEGPSTYILSVMFGSGTTVRRHLRNSLPSLANISSPCGDDDPSDGRAGEYTVRGIYDSAADPYSYLDTPSGQDTKAGCVFSVDGLSGTTISLDSGLDYNDYTRQNQPFWWWGVRNLPYYADCDTETPSLTDTRTFENSPSLKANRFFINVSDSMVRAFDYGAWETRSVEPPSNNELAYGPEPQPDATVAGDAYYRQPKYRREAIYSRYLAPSVSATVGKATGDGFDSGAGRVALGRPDIPERLTDRLYNLSITGARFGLAANKANILGSGQKTLGDVVDGPLDNRFRLQNGMGAVNSTGVFANLGSSVSIAYNSRYYGHINAIDAATTATLRNERRDPAKIVQDTGLTTNQLYIVGSDDGYVYAFDAMPGNARRVPASGGTAQTSTWAGRLVWAFHAAARVPMYHTSANDPLVLDVTAPGENPGTASKNGSDYVHLTNGALVAPSAPIVSGPITSSPVVCDIALDSSAFSHPGQTRTVVIFGSGMGRLFCLDAATGLEEWEFKTTPLGQTQIELNANTAVQVDSVAGQPILTSPTLGWLPGAASQLRQTAAGGRLAVFFGADDGKVYALDVADGSPIRSGTAPGWDVDAQQLLGAAGGTDRALLDHYGFAVYPFERGTTKLPSSIVGTKYGRLTPSQWGGKHFTASVVARPSAPAGYSNALMGTTIPTVDAIFVVSPTNQADASITNEPGFSGGTIWALNPMTGAVQWTFDRFHDVTRAVNTDFDKSSTADYTVRPAAFNVTPAYASGIQMFDEATEGSSGLPGNHDGEKNPLTGQNVLFAIDATGRMFALKTDAGLASVDRLYWRVPYPLTSSGVGQSGNVYSTPVVTSPDTATGNTNDLNFSLDGRSWVYVGTSEGLIAIDTTAMRTSPIVDVKNNLLPPATRYTGGELTWGWQTPRDSFVQDSTATKTTFIIESTPEAVVSTPTIHAGMVFAGSDNGLMYAWGHQADLFGSAFNFGNTGGGGRYTGRNRPRPPLPPGVRPPGGGFTQATGEFFVDIFQAGWNYGFSSPQKMPTAPTGAPVGNTSNISQTTTPQPIGTSNADFQVTGGGVLEWGDGIFVQAWGPSLNNAAAATSTIEDRGTVTFQLTGPSTSGSLKASIEGTSTQGFARQVFYLDPFTRRTPDSLLYPNHPTGEVINPLYGQMLRPGEIPPYYTVTAYYQPPDVLLPNPAKPGETVATKQPMQRVKMNALTKFHLANPINMTGYFKDGSSGSIVTAGTGSALAAQPDAVRNGNLDRIPVVPSVIGDHGVDTRATTTMQVVDRSHLQNLRSLANSITTKSGDDIALKVKVQPARMRWVGGPAACYKPLFHADGAAFANTWPLQTPPEPLWLGSNGWTRRRATFYDTSSTVFLGAEQPPYFDGEENKSSDYPDIDASRATWIEMPQLAGDAEADATRSDAPVLSAARFYLRLAVPKYQPANYAPLNVQVKGTPGVGPGYYTINPANSSAVQSAIMGWNPVGGSGKGGYLGLSTDVTVNNAALAYKGPLDPPGIYSLPATNSFIAQETQYLTKVYADVNGNGTADTDQGEAYRMFVTGAQVRPAESMRVTTATIDLPRSPETAIPGGYIPFQFYYDHQAAVAGAQPGDADKFLYGERNFYSPFAVYNNGNVNLWDLRVDKYDPNAGHLGAPSVDENYLFGADTMSNWPASGLLKRTNIASTLDALPIKSGAGSPADPNLWTPVRKPSPGSFGDEGQGQVIQVHDVFPFGQTAASRARTSNGSASFLNTDAGLPYLTIAVPPGTPPGRYTTQQGRFVLFEDSGGIYGSGRPYNGVLDLNSAGAPIESGITSDAQVTVNVSETRLTDKVAQLQPFLPNADSGVAFASSFAGAPGSTAELAHIWATLAQDTTPAAYRDPTTGDMVTFWSSNRRQVGKDSIPGLPAPPDAPSDMYRIFGTVMPWTDPVNPPVKNTADVDAFLTGVIATNPWGWNYYGGRTANNFFFPNFTSARWFGEPTVSPWLPSAEVVNTALGVPANTYAPLDLNYTSPGVITNFQGMETAAQPFKPMIFWTGQVGIGAETRSAIFYATVHVDHDTGAVTAEGSIEAVGVDVANAKRSLDPFSPKFAPKPFLITSGGTLSASGRLLPTAWLTGQEVLGLGVAWFGGAPGAWKLYVSTLKYQNGAPAQGEAWKTVQLPLPGGVVSAMYPSVYYHQWPQVLTDASGASYRQGTIEVAFTGYSRSGRNPDIYIARYIAMTSDADGKNGKISDFASMGFARKGGDPGSKANKPLEPLLRVAGEPRPVYRSHWVNWLGRRNLGTVIYWFQKPTGSASSRDYKLVATFTARNPGGNNANVVELHPDAQLATGGNVDAKIAANVSVFVNSASGTVRFATSDPVAVPAPMTRAHLYDGVMVQDYIYVAMNPYALRVTVDDASNNSQPQIWMDESHEVISGKDRQGETREDISHGAALEYRRDRLWVLWRRGSAPEGATKQSSLFYTTYRLGVDVGQDPSVAAGTPSSVVINLDKNGLPDVQILDDRGAAVDTVFTVDRNRGRIFFTEANDGDQVQVVVNGTNRGLFTIGWVPENMRSPTYYGTDTTGSFRLPTIEATEPLAVPTQGQGNDAMPWMFKDPWSNIPVSDPSYYSRANNSMWLFWSSTRPSRAYGNSKSAPDLANAIAGRDVVDPFYYDPLTGLMYASSASDVYYTTLSPDFTK
ncbi:MAG TPA: hypothetical protein VGM37_14860 [Armatimonadota bacterium]